MQSFFFVRDCKRYVKICFDEIIYVEALDNYLCLVTVTNKYTVRGTMAQFEKILPPGIFRRIHRSYIVSLCYIEAFNKSFVFLKDMKLPIAAQYKEDLPQSALIFPGADEAVIDMCQNS